MGRIRFLLFIAVAAIVGAIAGRVAAQVRRQQEAGEPISVSLDDVKIRIQDVVPGLVAAARVRDTPWSWLHIPSWMAAFGVNFGVGAVGGDLSRIREMAERAAFGFAGIELPGDDDPVSEVIYAVTDDAPGAPTSYAAPAPSTPATPPPPPPPPAAPFTSSNTGGSVTWTSPAAERRDDAPTAGFTAFSD